jgi:NADH dehydrogenase FAD-containing subunit
MLQKKYAVTLIDTKEYYEFTPAILRTIIEPEHIKKIQVIHTHYLPYATFIRDSVRTVQEHELTLKSRKKIPFDYLAICSGSSYNVPIKEQNVIRTDRAHHLYQYHEKLEHAKHVVIVGGGLVGVELAAEISCAYPTKKVTIIHSHEHLMQRNHPKSIAYATSFLTNRNVSLIYQDRVVAQNKGNVVTAKRKSFPADLVFLCTGIKPNATFMNKYFSEKIDEKDHIKVNASLQMEDSPHIFVAGDVSNRKEEKTAQNAEKEGCAIAENIVALDQGKPLKTYISRKRPMVISLGKWHGIFEYKNFVWTGFIPGIMKCMIEWKTMRKYR